MNPASQIATPYRRGSPLPVATFRPNSTGPTSNQHSDPLTVEKVDMVARAAHAASFLPCRIREDAIARDHTMHVVGIMFTRLIPQSQASHDAGESSRASATT